MKKEHIITVDKLYSTVKEIFTEYEREVQKVTDETIKEVASEGRKYIKDLTISLLNEPSKYQNCFRTQKSTNGRIIKNTRYQLSHLLEDGHISANQYGRGYTIYRSKYGTVGKKTKNFKMWETTEEMLRKEFPEKLEKNISNIK